MLNLNWWRVAAYGLLSLSILNFLASIVLGAAASTWALAALVSYGIVRVEWMLSMILTAATAESVKEPYE